MNACKVVSLERIRETRRSIAADNHARVMARVVEQHEESGPVVFARRPCWLRRALDWAVATVAIGFVLWLVGSAVLEAI